MISIAKILDWFKLKEYKIINESLNHNQVILSPRTISEAKSDQISFITEKLESDFDQLINQTECKLIIISTGLYNQKKLPGNITFIVSETPKNDIIEFCRVFLGFQKENTGLTIHDSSSISESSSLGKNVNIEAFTVIEENCIIGDNCTIGAGTVIKKGTKIGNNVTIGSCNVIGGTGFGYSKKTGNDSYDQFPHYGNVVIHDNVEIGNNTCIDRGSLSDTVIDENVKIDNLVHIAHNVKIGKNSLIIACSMIAGSVVIGKNSWVAPSSTIRNGITIGENTTIGLASTVTKSVLDKQTVMGSPAVDIKSFKNLRDFQKKIIDEYSSNNT